MQHILNILKPKLAMRFENSVYKKTFENSVKYVWLNLIGRVKIPTEMFSLLFWSCFR